MKVIALIIWMIISMMFVFSIVGLLLFIPKDNWEHKESTPSTWNTIGLKLLNSIIKN